MSKLSEIIERMRGRDLTLTSVGVTETISDEEMEIFSSELENNKTITYLHLNLGANPLTQKGLQNLARALLKNTSLTTLYIYNGALGEGGKAIIQALATNTLLKLTNLYLNRLDSAHAEGLARFLMINTTLTELNLGGHSFDDKAITKITQGIIENQELPLVNLKLNGTGYAPSGFGDEACRALAVMLRENHSIKYLDLSGLCIGSSASNIGFKAIINALAFNTSLEEFTCGLSFSLEEDIAQEFEATLTRNKTLKTLWIAGSIGERAARILLRALDTNNTLIELYLLSGSSYLSFRTMAFILQKIDRNRLRSDLVSSIYPYINGRIELKSIPLAHESSLLVDIEKWEKLNAPLLKAIYENNYDDMQKLLRAGADLEADAGDGTPLCIVCTQGYLKEKVYNAIKFLLERGANTEARSHNGWTPLRIVVMHVSDETIAKNLAQILLEAGANYEALIGGGTFAEFACSAGKKDLVEFIEREGSRIKALRATGIPSTLRSSTAAGSISSPAPAKRAEEKSPAVALVVPVREEKKLAASSGSSLALAPRPDDSNAAIAVQRAVVTTPASAEEIRALQAVVGSVDRRLGAVEAKTKHLNPAVLAKLNASEATLDCVIEGALNAESEDSEHKRVLNEEHLTAYYCMFLVLLEGSRRACENIYSGFGSAAKRGKADRTTQALDEAEKFIPGLGIPLKIISGIVKAGNFPDKQKAIRNLAFFFSQEATFPEMIIRALARRLAIEQAESLSVLFARSPIGFKEKAKQGFRELKNWFLADENHNPVMAKARADIEKIIATIIKGELAPPVNPEQIMKCVMGASYAVPPAKRTVSPTAFAFMRSTASSSPPIVVSPSVVTGGSDVSEGKEEKIERQDDAKRAPSPIATSPRLEISTNEVATSPQERTAALSDTPSPAELLVMLKKQATKLDALEAENKTTKAALAKSEAEVAKIKKDLDVSGGGGQSQMLVSANPRGARPQGYDPSFQAEDERHRAGERALAMHQDRLDQHEERLAAHAEHLAKKTNQTSGKCAIL